MASKILAFILNLVFLAQGSTDTKLLYDEFVSKVIDIEGIKTKVASTMGDIDESGLVALKMIDASTKIPSGLAGGNFFDLGHFDECYGIEYGEIYGKYCLGTFDLAGLKYMKMLGINTTQRPAVRMHPEPRTAGPSGTLGIRFAACVPSTMAASKIPGLIKYTEDYCYSKATEPKLSTGAIVTIVVLSIFGAIIVASTVLDVCFYYRGKEVPHELLIAFSFWTNGRKIFKSTTNQDQLLCLNGIKAISMMWVIIGHEYSNALQAPLSNLFDILEWQKDPANMFIFGATVSVDTFFTVGGLVTVYTFLKSMDKGVKFNVPMFYIHRYLRLTPAFAIMALIHLYLLNYLGNGPLWKGIDTTLVQPCEQGWWSSFLYITNYVQKGNCLPQTWYLSVDMQLFFLSPLILVPLTKWPKFGLGALGILSIVGCAVPFAIGYSEHLGSMTSGDVVKYMNDYYAQTYTRFGPYVIGMILGYYVYQIKKSATRLRLSPTVVTILWLVCLTGLTACVYAGYPLNVAKEEDRWGNSMFLAFNRPAWAVALSGVIFLCVSGYGGPVDYFLSLPIFQFLTKVSYAMYLVHYAVINVRYSAMKSTIKFSNIAMMHAFWGDFIFTLVLSVVLCLSFESPIIILEKYLFGRGRPKPTEEKKSVV